MTVRFDLPIDSMLVHIEPNEAKAGEDWCIFKTIGFSVDFEAARKAPECVVITEATGLEMKRNNFNSNLTRIA